jgi:FolB domain-containing protein
MASIYINNLEVETSIGITEEERANLQTLKISIDMETDLSAVCQSDDVNDTIDYAAVAESVKKLGRTERNTIEKFAEDTAQLVLKDFKPERVIVTVWKFILPDTEGVSITISRP